MDQKHQVEDILAAAGLPLTCLQASLFMEELWKRYTRPAILKGTFAFAMPPDKPLHLVSVKDMGRVAAQVVAAPDEFVGRAVPLAGDALTPVQLAAAFSAAQRHAPPVAYKHLPAWPFWLLNRDLYRICRFYSTQARTAWGMATLWVGYGIDAEACRARFGLQSFAEFLEETSWGDASIPPLS
ncbi:hypothetical protein CHLNCDRAFT_51737 [Chlorella variabilis]|uniref:NmrA-like domain-containing protein n=1 Tax=Chlorella variabilis TaxID=554065 RepID=E1ZCV6_CHLVA|nr:hypothetical protein CHLNCDRAFT_51737 [Chlorella variabilis]EFN56307.1 hypothetical protein CHLNCDRAFT_51737 [Chlorella variabilis]|eukprot:XP_005848409.1 hypothetical protein CHLNCDRAFT_51737 [Chlorella variabilis]